MTAFIFKSQKSAKIVQKGLKFKQFENFKKKSVFDPKMIFSKN